MEKVAVIGAGSWGCALSRILGDNQHLVTIYDIDKPTVDEINTYHTNKSKLKEGKLPLNVQATTNMEEAIKKSDIILLVVPTAVVRGVIQEIRNYLDVPKLFINASKGIEPNTYKRVSEIVYEEIPHQLVQGFVALTGPSHAEEVIMQNLTAVAAASDDLECAKRVQIMFSNQTYFRVYTVHDLIGAELGGSLKNIYALAAGICAGLGFGENAKAALITRGLAEMKRLAISMGAKEDTLNGLTGVGDLIVTCTSTLSRNYQAGFIIGNGSDLKQALSQMTMVVEGARTCIAAYQYAQENNLYTPIIAAVYHVIYEKNNPRQEIERLMMSALKGED